MNGFDPSARGSDTPRSKKQLLARKVASLVVAAMGLNRPGFLSTEIVQQIQPLCIIPTRFGELRCVAGHGRLRWRALTFYSEEPDTIKWLDSLTSEDVLWDVGANVGLYSIYAAKSAHCKVVAIEPEAQNYAILMENIVLNNVQHYVEAISIAVTNSVGMGHLQLHAMTKGGAYNQFSLSPTSDDNLAKSGSPVYTSQLQMGVSLDALANQFAFPCPTHIKIDVDGNEPEIIAGAVDVLTQERCKSVLIEVQPEEEEHSSMARELGGLGYTCVSSRSNWDSRLNRERESEHRVVNMIFDRDVASA